MTEAERSRPDIVRRAVHDGLWNAAALAVPGIANVVIVAILIRSLGPDGYAPWAAAVALLALLTVLDGGLSPTTARFVARAVAGEREAIESVRAAFAAYAVLAVVVLGLGCLAALVVPVAVDAEGDAGRDAVIVGLVLAMDLAVVIASGGWVGALRGARRFDLVFVATTIQVAVALPLTLVLVPMLGLLGAAVAQLLGRLAGRLAAAAALRRALAWVAILPGLVPIASLRRVGIFTLPIFAISASTQLGVGVDPIIVAIAAGPAAVGLYAAGGGLVRYLAFLLFPMLGVLLPSFSEIAYSGPGAPARAALIRCVRLAAVISALSFGTLAFGAVPALEAWIGRSDRLSVDVLILYAAAHVVWMPSQVMILMLIARGRHAVVGAALLLDATLNVAISIALALAIGPIGVALSTLVMLAIVHGVVIPAIAARQLRVAGGELFGAVALGLAGGGTVVALAALIPIPGMPGLVVRVAIAVGAGLVVLAADQRSSGVPLMRADPAGEP